jgi:1-phosphatidylinositol phosphodiesterase
MLRAVRFVVLTVVGALGVLGACDEPSGDDVPAWMSSLDDSVLLSELVIPGTHDSGAMLEPLPGLAATQELTIAEQLDAGVRFLDLRELWVYHGAIDQDQAFADVFATIYAFLDAYPDELVVASIKEETAASNATKAFDAIVAEYIAASPQRWDLRTTVPTLGDSRGRIVLVRRFPTTMAPLGIDASPWVDDATFAITNDAWIRIQDEYTVENNDEKWTAIQSLHGRSERGILSINFTSGYQTNDMGLPNILAVSDDINARLDEKFADERPELQGRPMIFVMDHVTRARVRAVILANQIELL